MRKKFLNRSERNEGVITAASRLFGGRQILTSRPEGMTFEDYKILRKGQNDLIKVLFAKAPNKQINQFVNPDLLNFRKGHMTFKQRVRQRRAS